MKSDLKHLFLIFVIFIAACIETDIYLPAFSDMMRAFNATEGEVQSLLTWNFVGICLAGPLYGPLSDAFGRKKPLVGALSLFLAGSLLTFVSKNLEQMLLGRILQGIGSGGCFTLGTAILFDAFQKEKAIHALNRLNLTVPLIMAGAPLLGGALNHAFGFRSNFLAIGFFVLISWLITVLFFKETLPFDNRKSFNLNQIGRDFKRALTSSSFWQLTLICSITFSGYIAFLSGTSVLFIIEFKMSKALFPLIQALILGGWVMGSLTLKKAVRSLGEEKVKRTGTMIAIFGGIWLSLMTLIFPKNPYLLTSGIMMYSFGANWIVGLYFPEAMELMADIKGTIASLLTSIRLCIASLVVGFSSSLYNGTIYPMTFVVIGSLLILGPLLYVYEKKRSKPVLHETNE